MVIAFTAKMAYYRILIQFFSSLSLTTVVNIALVIQVHKQLVASFCACKQIVSLASGQEKGLLSFQQLVSGLLSYQSELDKNRAFSTCPFSTEKQLLIFTVNRRSIHVAFLMPSFHSFWISGSMSFYLLTSTGGCLVVIPAVFHSCV